MRPPLVSFPSPLCTHRNWRRDSRVRRITRGPVLAGRRRSPDASPTLPVPMATSAIPSREVMKWNRTQSSPVSRLSLLRPCDCASNGGNTYRTGTVGGHCGAWASISPLPAPSADSQPGTWSGWSGIVRPALAHGWTTATGTPRCLGGKQLSDDPPVQVHRSANLHHLAVHRARGDPERPPLAELRFRVLSFPRSSAYEPNECLQIRRLLL